MLKNECSLPQIRDPFGNLFARLLEGSSDAPDASAQATNRTTPRTNIAESDVAYELSYELPGLTEQDINVQLQDKTLTVTAERKDARDEAKGTRWHRLEHRYGQYARAIKLPSDANNDGVEAVYEAGVLTVTVPKRAEASPARITVRKA